MIPVAAQPCLVIAAAVLIVGAAGSYAMPAIKWAWTKRPFQGGAASSDVKADDAPPAAVAEWAARYVAAAPGAPPDFILKCLAEGKTVLQVVVDDRARILKP